MYGVGELSSCSSKMSFCTMLLKILFLSRNPLTPEDRGEAFGDNPFIFSARARESHCMLAGKVEDTTDRRRAEEA